MVFLHELSVSERVLVAGDNGPFDLPVNPVSFLLLHFRADCAAGAVDFQQLLGHITSILVDFKGTQIIQQSGQDLVRMVQKLWGRSINIENFNAVAPALISFTLPIPFSRKPFWSKECFPATRRGEFHVTVTRSATLTNIANPVFSIEGVQLLEAEPSQFLKMVTLSKNIIAGDADMELPIGNPLLGMHIFSPTSMANTPISESIRRFRLQLDNVEYDFADAGFDSSRAIGFFRSSDNDVYTGISGLHRNYTFLDFDPFLDDAFMVDTEGRASVKLKFVPDVSGLVRVMPIELVRLGGSAAAA